MKVDLHNNSKRQNSMDKTLNITKIMNTRVVAIAPQTNLVEVEQIFRQYPHDFIPVQYQRQLVGAIERNDFMHMLNDLKEQGMQSGGALAARSVESIINQNIIQLSTDNTIEEAIEIFDTGLYNAIPVVNAQQKLVGIITPQDLAEHVSDNVTMSCASRGNWK